MYDLNKFRFWCYKVLPLVYDDSLSYYEVLCKVVDYINKLIDQDKEMAGEITDIQAWINAFDEETVIPIVKEAVDEYVATLGQMKILFIGDSYAAEANGNWPRRVGNLLGLTENSDYWVVSESGSGFASGTWLSRLQTWVTDHPLIVPEITHIVCAGGINDAATTYFSNLYTALQAFGTYCKATFTKAKVKVAYIGACWYDSATYAERPLYNQIGVISAYSKVGAYGMEYMPGCEMVMHNVSYLKSDRIHPNDSGGAAISYAIYDALKNGCAYVMYRGTVTLQPTEEAADPSFTGLTIATQYVEGNTVNLNANIQIDSISGLTLTNNFVTVGKCELPFTTQMHRITAPILIRVSSAYSWHVAELYIQDGLLKMKIQEQDPDNPAQWLSFTPNRIVCSFSVAGNGHEF